MQIKVKNKGVIIKTKDFTSNFKKQLTIESQSNIGGIIKFQVFKELDGEVIIPYHWALNTFTATTDTVIKDCRKPPKTIEVQCNGTLQENQKDHYKKIKEQLESTGRGILQLQTGLGKTFISLKLLSEIKVKTMIVSASVNQIDLVLQWEQQIKKFLNTGLKIAVIGGKRREDPKDADIIITTVSSLRNTNFPQIKKLGMVIIDECHHIASPTNSQCFYKFGGVKYILAVSATPERPDGLHKVLNLWIGENKFKDSTRQIIGLKPKVITYKIKSEDAEQLYKEFYQNYRGEQKISFVKMLNQLVTIPQRNILIVDILTQLLKIEKHRNVLLVSDRIQHLKLLKEILDTRKFPFSYGLYIGTQMNSQEKKETMSKQVILATCQSFGEGIDKKELDTIILTTPKKYKQEDKVNNKSASISFNQIIGRIFRKEHQNTHPLVVDIWDQFSIYKNQGYTRMSFYKKELGCQKQDIEQRQVTITTQDTQGNCFAGWQQVYTYDELTGQLYLTDIATIYNNFNNGRPTQVISLDMEELEEVKGQVINVKKSQASCMLFIEVDYDLKNPIDCTPEHLFLTQNLQWVKAQNLQRGDVLYGGLFVTNIQQYSVQLYVYDLQIDKFHNFKLGSGVIAHNCEIMRKSDSDQSDSDQSDSDQSDSDSEVLSD